MKISRRMKTTWLIVVPVFTFVTTISSLPIFGKIMLVSLSIGAGSVAMHFFSWLEKKGDSK